MGMDNNYSCGATPVYNVGSGCNDGLSGGGSWIWVLLIFILLVGGIGGNGFGGGYGFGGAGSPGNQGSLTRSDLCEGFNFHGLQNQVQDVQKAAYEGFYAMNTGMLNGFHGMENVVNGGFTNTNTLLNQARFDAQNCCCETNRNIDALRFEGSKNACDIVTAIKEDGAATRALINANTMQDLRDRLVNKENALMAAQFQLSQQRQNADLVGELRPCAKPAYITCSPYQATFGNCGNFCC